MWLRQNLIEQVPTELYNYNPLVKMHTQMTQQIEKFNVPAVSLKQVNEKPLTYRAS